MGLVGESGGGKSTVGRTVLRLTEATGGGVTFEGIDVMKASRGEMNSAAQGHADRLPGPVRLAQPAHAHPRHRRRGAQDPRHRHRGRAQEARRRAARDRRPQLRARRALPARVLGRAAPAHRHRPRPGAQPQAHHPRRAGERARRLHPRPGAQPARGSAGRVRPHVPVRLARPLRGQAHLRPRGRACTSARSSRSATAPCSTTCRSTRTPRRCSRRCPSPTRTPSGRAGASSSRATCRARPTRRAAACSIRAAPGRRRSAPRPCRGWSSTGDAGARHEVACYFPARFVDGKRVVSDKPYTDALPEPKA